MMMKPNLRKITLTAHMAASVGWFGAVAGFLALAVTGLISRDAQVVRAAYLAMDLITSFVIVPFAFAALLTGIVSSLGTKWGLFRYYWVVVKLLITMLATAILLVHTRPISLLAGIAAQAAVFSADLRRPQIQMVVASGGTVVVLLVLIGLSVYKPRGMTPYGWRKQHEQSAVSPPVDAAL